MDDMLNYGGIERLLDGLVVQDFPEMDSEADTADGEESRIAAAIRDSETDQDTLDRAESSAPVSSSHRNGESSGSETSAIAESDNDEAVPTSLLGSDPSSGDNTVASTIASTESEQHYGCNRASSTPASTSPNHGEAEHSSLATPALTFSEYSADGNSEAVTPRSTDSGEWHGSPVVHSSAGSDHNDADEEGGWDA